MPIAKTPSGIRGTAKIQRVMNSLTALDMVIAGQRTVAQMSEHTGLSRTATEAVAKRLVEIGWLADSILESGRRGRPAREFSLAKGVGFVAGLDFGPHTMRLCIADLGGATVWYGEKKATEGLLHADRVRLVEDLVEKALVEGAIAIEDIRVIAVGAAGIVSGGVVTHCGPLPDLVGVDLAGELRHALGRPVIVENDCNLAAIGERWRGTAQGVSDLVYVLAGERIGSGIVIRGDLLRGRHGGAGETGALAELEWLTAHSLLGTSGRSGSDAPMEVFSAARRGDRGAQEAIEQYSQALAKGIAALVLTIDPELVVIGGGISAVGDQLREPVQRRVAELCHVRPVEIRFSELGARGVVQGAIRIALDTFYGALGRVSYENEELLGPEHALLTRMLG